MNPLGGQKRIVSPNFLNIVLTPIGVFNVLRQRLHDNDRIVKAKNRKVFCLQEFLKYKWRATDKSLGLRFKKCFFLNPARPK